MIRSLLAVAVVSGIVAGCAAPPPAAVPTATQSHMNMLQLMRAFPYPHSNVIFEMAPLLLVPRACANGKSAPVDRDDWKKAVEGLVVVGQDVAKEARAKNMDAMLDLSEKVANACAACHDRYRDVDLSGGVRCDVPGASKSSSAGE
jgi:hypothetical protein